MNFYSQLTCFHGTETGHWDSTHSLSIKQSRYYLSVVQEARLASKLATYF